MEATCSHARLVDEYWAIVILTNLRDFNVLKSVGIFVSDHWLGAIAVANRAPAVPSNPPFQRVVVNLGPGALPRCNNQLDEDLHGLTIHHDLYLLKCFDQREANIASRYHKHTGRASSRSS